VLLVQKSNKNKSKTRSVEIKITRKNCLRSVGHPRAAQKKRSRNESRNHKNPLLATENHHQIIIEPKNWIIRFHSVDSEVREKRHRRRITTNNFTSSLVMR
jgi:hypothetical protein